MDPVLQIFGPGGGLGILALALLWLLTTISVVLFFVRRGNSTGKVVLASFATLALAAALVLVVSNPTLRSVAPPLAAIFVVMPLVFFGVGMLLSRRSTGELASISSVG